MRRRALVVLVACFALAGALASTAGSIPATPAIFLVAPASDAPGQTVVTALGLLPTGGDTFPAASVSIYVPAGYTLNLSYPPGTTVGNVAELSSFSQANLTVVDPTTVTTDPCAPGTHAAVWQATLTVSGQSVVVNFFVDPTTGDETARGAYRITYCQSAALLFSLQGVVTSPAAPGIYTWRAFVTPPGANGAPPDPNTVYELRATVPIPYVVTAKATYTSKTRTFVLTGKVVAGAAPEPGAEVVVERLAGQKITKFGSATTNANGTYTIKKLIRQTKSAQTLHLDVGATEQPGACTAPPLAPAGCLAQTDAVAEHVLTARIPKLPPKPKPKPKKH